VHSYYTFIAMDLAQQRVREAEQRRQLYLSRNPDAATKRSFRHAAAVAIAAVSRFSGRLARRLDERVVPTH
jgi:hypothetical protein